MKFTSLRSCIATRLGGCSGFSLININKGIETHEIQIHWMKISLFSADYINSGLLVGVRPAKRRPDIVNAKMFPDGIERPQIAVANVRWESGNHLLQIRFIAA